MMLTPGQWDLRYQRQAGWTRSIRAYLFSKFPIPRNSLILEVGCGTGAVLSAQPAPVGQNFFGLDIRLDHLGLAGSHCPKVNFTCADALWLPYPDSSFDLTFCHFFLLWVSDPARALTEMKRVTRSGGMVAALAEPDYGARIDFPDPLATLGRLQGISLAKQGADITTGRKLAGLLHGTGLQQVQTGLLGGEWGYPPDAGAWESEWEMFETDLEGSLDTEEMAALRRLDAASWEKGDRILFVPTFYSFGFVP